MFDPKVRFKEEWLRGRPVKVISHELGIPEPTLRNWRRKMGLPLRRTPKGVRVSVTIHLRPAAYNLVKRRARTLQLPLARYITNLIERDN